jgi:hypothetical protein
MTIVLDDETPKDFKPLIESSTYRSYQEYVKAGLENDTDRSDRPVKEQYNREMKFLTAVKISDEKPLTRKITKMIRFKDKGQEYLTFTEDWRAFDWVGRQIDPVIERMEGILVSPRMDPVIDEKGQRIGKRKNGVTKKYEIPFSKENVDKWLEETKTPKDEVIYTVNGPNALSGECVAYEQFIYPWNKAVDILMKDGGFQTDYMDGLKKK